MNDANRNTQAPESSEVRESSDPDARFRHVFEASPAGLMISDREGRIILANREAQRIFDYSDDELQQLRIEALVPARHRGNHEAHRLHFLAEDRARAMGPGGDLFGLRRDGSEIPIEVGLRPLDFDGRPAVLATVLDLTERMRAEAERQRLQQRLRRAQKMETIGTLAGGIAHDFNNILTPILGHAELVLSALDPADPQRSSIEEIRNGADRAASLVRQILLFSRRTEVEKKTVRLEAIVEEALCLVRPAIPATVEIRQQLSGESGLVSADAAQIHQVIVNLCTNAWQAMQDQGGGVLGLVVEPVEIDAELAELYPRLHPGPYARLSVSDTGGGMDEQTLEQIFEPFFTTKEVGKGTGLGLSIVHGIVEAHGGELVVYSEPGHGTVFHVYLPLAAGETHADTEQGQVVGGRETLVVVDDDRAVGSLLKRILEALGYRVQLYDDSRAAWHHLQEAPGEPDLLLSDLTMPKITGLELARKTKERIPELPILLMTGYGGDLLPESGGPPDGVHAVLQKPLLVRDLANAVRRALDESAADQEGRSE